MTTADLLVIYVLVAIDIFLFGLQIRAFLSQRRKTKRQEAP